MRRIYHLSAILDEGILWEALHRDCNSIRGLLWMAGFRVDVETHFPLNYPTNLYDDEKTFYAFPEGHCVSWHCSVGHAIDLTTTDKDKFDKLLSLIRTEYDMQEWGMQTGVIEEEVVIFGEDKFTSLDWDSYRKRKEESEIKEEKDDTETTSIPRRTRCHNDSGLTLKALTERK